MIAHPQWDSNGVDDPGLRARLLDDRHEKRDNDQFLDDSRLDRRRYLVDEVPPLSRQKRVLRMRAHESQEHTRHGYRADKHHRNAEGLPAIAAMLAQLGAKPMSEKVSPRSRVSDPTTTIPIAASAKCETPASTPSDTEIVDD